MGLRSNIVRWIAIAILLYVVISAARIGAADLFSVYARDEMYAWSTGKSRPDAASLDNVSRALATARMISPGDPNHYEDMANLALIRAGMFGVTESARDALVAEGIERIHMAIALRPVSAYSWATLLLLKRERAEYDPEFVHALERAVTLGPWEPEVQLIVADVGASAWAALPQGAQEMVRENFVRGMKRQARQMLAISAAHRDDCNSPRARLNAGCQR